MYSAVIHYYMYNYWLFVKWLECTDSYYICNILNIHLLLPIVFHEYWPRLIEYKPKYSFIFYQFSLKFIVAKFQRWLDKLWEAMHINIIYLLLSLSNPSSVVFLQIPMALDSIYEPSPAYAFAASTLLKLHYSSRALSEFALERALCAHAKCKRMQPEILDSNWTHIFTYIHMYAYARITNGCTCTGWI